MSWPTDNHHVSHTPNNNDEAFDTLFGPQFAPSVQGGSSKTSVQGSSPSTVKVTVSEAKVDDERLNALPLEVMIITADHEIKGLIHVSRADREERRISTLLNNPHRRFLAVTDAQVIHRNTPSSPRRYSFLQLHVDNIMMIHPSAQSLIRQANTGNSTPEEGSRFIALRERLNQVSNSLP
jgi:hypothetical protein